VPDLAFSEMEFLRRSNQRPVDLEEKSLSKSREKEKRKAERVQNEISEYFHPSASLRADDKIKEKSGGQEARYTDERSRRLPKEEFVKENYQSSYSKSTSLSIDLSRDPLNIERRGQTFEQVTAVPHSRGHIVQPSVAPDSRRELFDRETSYFTCSDSIRSPGVPRCKEKICSVASTTPGPIRQLLDKTGVFADTGIDRTTGRRQDTSSKGPVRYEVHVSPYKRPAFQERNSQLYHTHKPSHARQQTHRPVQTVEIIMRDRCNLPEAQTGHLDDYGESRRDDGELPRPLKTIIERYSPESGWKPRTTHEESLTHSHLLKAEVSNQHIPRQAIARAAYVKKALPTDATTREVYDAQKSTLSTGPPEQDRITSKRQHTEQAMQTESNSDIAGNLPPSSSGVGKTGRDRPPTAPINSGNLSLSSKSTTSDLPQRSRLDTFPGANQKPCTSSTVQIIPYLPNSYNQVKAGAEPIVEPNLREHSHIATGAHGFEGLPVRGSWPGLINGPDSLLRIIPPPGAIDPFYSHQLKDRIPYDMMGSNYNDNLPHGRIFHQFNTRSREHCQREEPEPFDTYGREKELIGEAARLQEFDAVYSQAVDPGVCMVEEEEEPPEWELCHLDMLHHHAARVDAYEGLQLRSSSAQQQLLGVNAHRQEESQYYQYFYEPIRSLVRGQGGEELPGLSGFWQPRRQY
jgi:hypothetical protein